MAGADAAQIVVAATALIATLAGVRQASAGRRDTQRQQVAANELEKREQTRAEADTALQHAREDAEIAYRRLQEERAEVLRVSGEKSAEIGRLRAELSAALLDRSTLQSIVQDEVAREALRTQREIQGAEKPSG